jgi:hypothetical protein
VEQRGQGILKYSFIIYLEGLVETKKKTHDSHFQSKNPTQDLSRMKQENLPLSCDVFWHYAIVGLVTSLLISMKHSLTNCNAL